MNFGSINYLRDIKLQDDLLIIMLAVIAVLMAGVIFLAVRSVMVSHSIETILHRKLKHKAYSEVISLAKEYFDSKKNHKSHIKLMALYYMAQAYESLENHANALKYYLEASYLATGTKKLYHSILMHCAAIYDRLGKKKESLAYYMMVLEKDGGNHEALFELARFQYRNKNTRKAREYLEKLLAKRPGLLEARLLYGRVLVESGQHPQALKQFQLLEKYDYENFAVFYHKAKVQEQLKRYYDAIGTYQYILEHEWKRDDKIDAAGNSGSDTLNLLQVKEDSQISIINLSIKLKDYYKGIELVSDYLARPSSDNTKMELLYLYANLLWNTGDEFQALKNFERVYLMKPDYKDVGIMVERYKKILPHAYLNNYFTSYIEDEKKSFDTICKKIIGKHQFNLVYQNTDFYIYSKGVFYILFYRHIEPVPFSKLTDMEIIINSYDIKPQTIELYSISGVREDAITHFLLKISHLIEGDEFIKTIKQTLGKDEKGDSKKP